MTRGDLKTGRSGSRTPFQILADYHETGDTRDRHLWSDYARAARHLAAVRWSRGLRAAMLGPSGAPERTDLELATEDTNGELVTDFSATTWSTIRHAGLDLALLSAAENSGHSAVRSLMASVGQCDLTAYARSTSDM
jgi:hypothetical protein